MQIDNQTLSIFLHNVIQECSKPDYVGWVIGIAGTLVGIAAVILAVIFHLENQRLRKQRVQEKKDREIRSAGVLSLQILGTLLVLEQTEIYETEMREKGLIPVTLDFLEDLKKPNNKQRLSEFKQLEEKCVSYAEESKKNIENIEKTLNLVYNDLDNELVHELTMFLFRFKDWNWKSSMYQQSELLIMNTPTASGILSQLKKIYDELVKITDRRVYQKDL
jgi:hypothetical protein